MTEQRKTIQNSKYTEKVSDTNTNTIEHRWTLDEKESSDKDEGSDYTWVFFSTLTTVPLLRHSRLTHSISWRWKCGRRGWSIMTPKEGTLRTGRWQTPFIWDRSLTKQECLVLKTVISAEWKTKTKTQRNNFLELFALISTPHPDTVSHVPLKLSFYSM